MNLEEYLTAIKRCPARRVPWKFGGRTFKKSLLHLNYGIYDNYAILLQADYKQVVQDFMRSPHDRFSGAYTLARKTEGEEGFMNQDLELRQLEDLNPNKGLRVYFDYVPGTVFLQVINEYRPASWTEGVNEKQKKIFNMTIMIHPYQRKKVKGKHHHKVMAEVITDVCQYAMKKNLLLCLFNARKGSQEGYGEGIRESNMIYYPERPALMHQ